MSRNARTVSRQASGWQLLPGHVFTTKGEAIPDGLARAVPAVAGQDNTTLA